MKFKSTLSTTAFTAMLLALVLSAAALSAPPPMSSTEMLTTLEKTLYGSPVEGAIIPRVAALETVILGKAGEGTLTERVNRLWEELGGGREGVLSLDYKIKLAQWIVNGKVRQGSLLERLSALEDVLFGFVSKESLPVRIERMIETTTGKGGVDATYAKLAAGTPVKIIIKTALKSSSTRPGDKVVMEVAEDVFIGDRLAIPSGTQWTSEAADPTKSNKYDLKNLLELVLEPVLAIDGTPVRLYADDGAVSATQILTGLLICQGERPERLGFFALGTAVDRLLPGNKNLDIINGTKIVLSVREDVSVVSAKVR